MKDKLITYTFIITISLFFIINLIAKDKDISKEERRHLNKMPEISLNSIYSETFKDKFDSYTMDQFCYREKFKQLKGFSSKIFLMKENNNILKLNNNLFQTDYSTNINSLNHLTDLINNINNEYLKNNKNKYFILIPDKNYYIKDESIPRKDYNLINKTLENNLDNNIKFIELSNELNLDSYYKTDIHWKQDKLDNVVNKLSNYLDLKTDLITTTDSYYPFYGSLFSNTTSNIKGDKIIIKTNEVIENAKVYNYETKKTEKVYEKNNLKNIDSYDIFLGGATPLLEITNTKEKHNKELIVFRDSFASSLTPLLINSYSKITLIDLRYFGSSNLKNININKKADVLFMYSIPIINNSYSLK